MLALSAFGMSMLAALPAAAQETVPGYEDKIFKAKVIEILDEQTIQDEYTGKSAVQQNLTVRGLEGEWTNQEYNTEGITDFIVSDTKTYKVGDAVYVNESLRPDQENRYFVMDHVRTKSLWWMAVIFAACVLLVARLKGLRALLVLAATFVIIIKFIVPQIITGQSPLLVSIAGAIAILFLAIFVTEGFNKKSAVAFAAILVALLGVIALSEWFTQLAHLSGLATDEAAYLLGIADYSFDLRGLLLAGMVIGALGVLDDTVVSQVSLVKEIIHAKPDMRPMTVFHTAMRVGTDHINAIINTLFLAYAGVSLPLLVLFVIYDEPSLSLEFVLNGELIATEIVRTLAGSIALVTSVPIATALAVYAFGHRRRHA